MTAPPALPSLPGLAWSRHKKPGFSTRVASHASGREVRVALMNYPLYEFETAYNGLTSASAPAPAQTGLGASSLQSLMGFFLQLLGQAGVFLYTDPDDNTVVGQAIGVGDGATQCFVIGRTLGGFNEPVGWVAAIADVYLNGVAQASSGWVFTAPNSLGFYTAPGAGVAITADFSFAFQCRFLDDRIDFEEFMASLWKLGSMKFRSVKANTTPAAAPQWYNLYSTGGTLASLVADFTTEGAADHYYYNGSTYAIAAAYETAVGLSETRSSAATYANSSGLLASAASGVLRIADCNPVALTSKGVLLEGASTNVLYPSNNPSGFNTGYFGTGGTIAGSSAGPDGVGNSAILIQNGTATSYWTPYIVANGGSAIAGTYTYSVYAKAGASNWLCVTSTAGYCSAYFNLASGTIGSVQSGSTASIAPAGNGWYRCSVTFTFSGQTPYFAAVACSSNGQGNYGSATFAGGGNSVYLWGLQVEQLPFASSYIPTTTGSASRSADSFQRTRTNPTSITKLIKAATPPGTPAAECTLWSADDGTDNNYLRVVYYSDGHIHVLVEAAGSPQANLDMGAVTASAAFALALTAAAGNFAASINGGAAVSTSSGSMPTGLVHDRLGSGVDAGYEWFSDIALDAEWTNLVATGAQLAALS